MAHVSNTIIRRTIPIIVFVSLFALSSVRAQSQYDRPIAEAGLSRYAAQEPVVLDGTGSYDPDDSGTLSYTWRQVSGPSVVIGDANTTTPTISGFVQTSEIQECELELAVSDGDLTGLPDTVKVIIVPDFSENLLELRNDSFDPHKPTLVYFGGGDCTDGTVQYSDCPLTFPGWLEKANIMYVPKGYGPDPGGGPRTYYRCGDMILVYLSAVAPDYKQPIQTCGWSTGGQPAIDAGRYLNLTYQDRRYAINRVTFFDATPYCQDYSERISEFLGSSVDGEQCWVDNYVSSSAWSSYAKYPYFYNNVLNIWFEEGAGGSAYGSTEWLRKHRHAQEWYNNSLSEDNMKDFNSGVVAGASWSVIGPGKNLQLASTPDSQTYKFQWYGWNPSGYVNFYDEAQHAGRLPEPVTLVGPVDAGGPDGAILTCKESENAVAYQFLFGTDPRRVMDYDIISDTSTPPVITELPFDEGWWTVKVRDQYGSTIYADPRRVNALISSLPIENMTTGRRFGYIQDAIDDAASGDEIVTQEGLYRECIDFQGKDLTVRSTDPGDSTIVAATILTGNRKDTLVTFSNNEDESCVLAGLTITGGNNGVICSAASPTIVNCRIVANVTTGMKLYMGSNPTISNCIIAEHGNSGITMYKIQSGRTVVVNSPTVVNCTIVNNSEIGISEGMPTIVNSIIYGNGVQIAGSSGIVKYSSVQGGFPGEGNIDTDPLFTDPESGDYHLKSQAGRWDPLSQSRVQDDVTSPCIDAGDPASPIGLEPAPNGGRINMGAYGGTAEASKGP